MFICYFFEKLTKKIFIKFLIKKNFEIPFFKHKKKLLSTVSFFNIFSLMVDFFFLISVKKSSPFVKLQVHCEHLLSALHLSNVNYLDSFRSCYAWLPN